VDGTDEIANQNVRISEATRDGALLYDDFGAALRQDGADGVMLLFDAAGRSEGTHHAEGNGWDKPSDINVQVFAHRVGIQHPGQLTSDR
jgi:hypothetical protein